MKLEGYRRLEAHVPTDLWDEIEKARGQMTRSEFTRQALRAQLDYPSMVSAPEALAGNGGLKAEGAPWPMPTPTLPAAPAKTPRTAEAVSDAMKAGAAIVTVGSTVPAGKTAREILSERTRLMRGKSA